MSSRRRTSTAETPQLGDLTFEEWYQTPVFEAEPDERLEHLATSRRAPLRLLAGAMIRLAPDRHLRPEPTADPEPTWQPEPTVDRETTWRPEPEPEPGPRPGSTSHSPGTVEPPATPDTEAGAPAPAGSWRQRVGHLLDRWAEAEAASQQRLEALMLPKRWRA